MKNYKYNVILGISIITRIRCPGLHYIKIEKGSANNGRLKTIKGKY